MIVETILVCSVVAAVSGLLALLGILFILWVKWMTWQDVKSLLITTKYHAKLNEDQKVKTVENLTETRGVLGEIREENVRTREAAKEAAKTVVQKAEEIKQVVAQVAPSPDSTRAGP